MENVCPVDKNRRQQTADVWVLWHLGRLNQFHYQMYSQLVASNPGNFLSPAYHSQNTFRTNRHRVPNFFSSAQSCFQPASADWLNQFAKHLWQLSFPWPAMLQHFERESRNSHFRLQVSLALLISVPPNWQRHTTKASEKFHPLSLYYFRRIFGERSYPPRNCESQTSKVSFPDLVLAGRARIKNSKWPP